MPRKTLPQPTVAGGNTYVGNPCKRGHDGLRYVLKGACVQCALDARAAAKPTDHSRALKRAWKIAHAEAVARDKAGERQRRHAAKAKRDASLLPTVRRLTQKMIALRKALPVVRKPERTKAERAAYARAKRDELKARDPVKLRLIERLGRKRRRHQARTNGGVHPSQAELRAMLGDARWAYCGSDDRIEIYHKVPLCNGGQDTIGNLQPLCHDCNVAKGRTDDDTYRRLHDIL